ncbi:MAG: WYL domain-containing protein [Rhodospirillaceae bacterium]|nr:WYL domain-containing protein [Rhodospirillaceae bacterium]
MRVESSPSRAGPALRWSVEQRLAFIEARLFWLGHVNRTDLVTRFGVSMSQASNDIARYLALAPPGLAYDKSVKRYVAGPGFRPVLAPPDAVRFLGELQLIELGILSPAEATLGGVPPFDGAPLPRRAVDAYVLRAVLAGMRERRAVSVLYQSMSRPAPMRRTIEPHALAHDGFRWHARAFDHETRTFRDFVLGRMRQARAAGPATARPEDDAEWHRWVPLRIAPHPALTPAQAKAIRLDYGIAGAAATLRVRQSLLFYALRRLGLDTAPGSRPPQEQHIVLVNRDEVMPLVSRQPEA